MTAVTLALPAALWLVSAHFSLRGTLLNTATVIVGALLGRALGRRLPERLRETAMHGIGLLAVKSTLDGISAVAFASALGWGCCSLPGLLLAPVIVAITEAHTR